VTRLRIDGRDLDARPGETVLAAARRAGIDIPSLCDHELLRPYGACRLCVVEVRAPGAHGRPSRARIAAACEYPALDGLEVATRGERVDPLRRTTLRLLLARAPEAPKLRALAERLGVVGPVEPDPAADGCILCGLCVRACAEAVHASAIGFTGRGHQRGIGMPFGENGEACVGCGACDWICPTAILRSQADAAERFRRAAGEDRLCRYARLGLVPGALCALSFECHRCDVEQTMRARFGGEHPALGAERARRAAAGPEVSR
jgi:predicted molibdopterin-dependent oxidoreductase YjgC